MFQKTICKKKGVLVIFQWLDWHRPSPWELCAFQRQCLDNLSFDTHPYPTCLHLYYTPQLTGLAVCLSHAVKDTKGKKSQAYESNKHCGMPHLVSLDTAHVPNSAKMKLADKSSPVIGAVFIWNQTLIWCLKYILQIRLPLRVCWVIDT